ncbi:MAG: hypothetical protein JO264_21850 [Acidisphaera sp.]|nr:hypothetical protein [Acidisphaera sp.]
MIRAAGRRASRIIPVLALLLPIAVILLHAGLIPAGNWRGDEYYHFAMLKEYGSRYLIDRLLTWSPRPISEGFLYLYYELVTLARRPLVTPFLLVFWAMLVLGSVCGFCPTRRSLPRCATIPLSVVAMFLLRHPIDELFYWPMGAAAYLAALSALTFLTFLVVRGGPATSRGRLAGLAAMLVAEGSAEIGAIFVCCFAPLLLCLEGMAMPRAAWRRPMALARNTAWLVVPLAAGLYLLHLLLLGRVTKASEAQPGASASLYHHIGPSILAAAQQFGSELTGSANLSVSVGLFFAGLALAMRQSLPGAVSRRQLAVLAAAFCITAYLSIAAADYQFGVLCCERHTTFRQCALVLAIVALARLAADLDWGWRLRAGVAAIAGPVLVALSLSILSAARMPALVADYRAVPAMTETRRENWSSGFDKRSPAMLFALPPLGRIVGGLGWPTGDYALSEHPPWNILGILQFFGKQQLQVVQAPSR